MFTVIYCKDSHSPRTILDELGKTEEDINILYFKI